MKRKVPVSVLFVEVRPHLFVGCFSHRFPLNIDPVNMSTQKAEESMDLNQGYDKKWFALQVRTRTEHRVATMLRAKGYEDFVPTRTVKRRSLSLQLPLFPGYVFCRIDAHVSGLVVTTPGIIRIVKFGGKPAAIDPQEIVSIQLLVNSGAPTSVMQGLQPGDKICIEDGPLRGAVGILTSFRTKQRLLVSISMMMRTVVAEVDPEWVASVRRTGLWKAPVSEWSERTLAQSA
jgi:transcription antitermination factor NusG